MSGTLNYLLLALLIAGSGGNLMISEPTESDRGSRNRLTHSKNPYLLQHADNPVDWHEWSSEAFELARKQDKPIFLSIGYSTCHWCHVMAHESFEDPQVASLMNAEFVNIKVDREERPDIDQVYMAVCQMMTGSGGWPLTIIMTPDKQPFFAATYVPRETRYGSSGMLQLVPRVGELWRNDRASLLEVGQRVTTDLAQAHDNSTAEAPGVEVLARGFAQLESAFDRKRGGFGDRMKFPTPHNLTFLLRHWQRSGDQTALDMVTLTLDEMGKGGIWDHLGFGFHRYSTDPDWLVPHFEKMLYDQALMALAYLEAYQATGRDAYGDKVRQILAYVERDLAAPEGGFYAAEDADSQGEEGKFYVWSAAELTEVLEPAEFDFAARFFNVTASGNFHDPHRSSDAADNILHLDAPLELAALEAGLSVEAATGLLATIRSKLLEHRNTRVRPHRDEKILTDWNGLMIAAFARAAVVLGQPEYAVTARQAVMFLLGRLRDSQGRLLHRYYDGDAGVAGMLDDYAFFVFGLLELHQASQEIEPLRLAVQLTRAMVDDFRDPEGAAFFLTSAQAEELLVRPLDSYDGALPSGNSVAVMNLLRLARLTGDQEFEAIAQRALAVLSGDLRRSPSAHTQLLQAVDFAAGPAYEVVVAGGERSSDTRAMLEALHKQFVPNKVVLFRPDEERPAISGLAPYTLAQQTINGRATAYVCRNYACKRPTNEVAKMLQHLGL